MTHGISLLQCCLLWVAGALLCLAGYLSFSWVVTTVKRMREYGVSEMPKIELSERKPYAVGNVVTLKRRKVIDTAKIIREAAKLGAMMVVCFVLYVTGQQKGYVKGYMDRETLYQKRLDTRSNVLVRERHNAKEFELESERGQIYQVRSCFDLDWQRGEKMQFYNFQQAEGCKNIPYWLAYTDHVTGDRLKFPIREFGERDEVANAR